VLLSLSTAHTIGLALVAGSFIVFALLVAVVIPRRRPDFPGKHLRAFVWIAILFFVVTLVAVNFFGAESKEAKATGNGQSTPTATTGSTSTQAVGGGTGDATKGKALYTSLGCIGCHSLDGSKGTGPTFKGLVGSKVQLTSGQTVTADAAYLEKSIEDPDAEVVQGFSPGIMSAVIKPGSVSQANAQDLAAFIQQQK
jgi:cytochrome c551/c552